MTYSVKEIFYTLQGEGGQAGTGHKGVFDVRGKAVVVGQHGGNAALRPGACTVLQLAFGDDSHAVRGRQVQGGRETGEAAAYDEYVKVVGCHGGHSLHWKRTLFKASATVERAWPGHGWRPPPAQRVRGKRRGRSGVSFLFQIIRV